MIGRVATLQVPVEKVDEAIDVAKQAVVAVAERQIQGHRGYLNLVDRTTGKFITIQLWETDADAAAFTSGPLFREVMGRLMPLLIAPPVADVYEVAVKTEASGHGIR